MRPNGTREGFTIVELMIVVTIIAIIAAIAVPNLISSRLNANEVAAASLIRTVTTAQQQFVQSGKADEDSDGAGEFGTFAEMGARIGIRGGAARVPTDLTQSLALVNAAGEVQRNGYILRMYLPGPGGQAERERPLGGMPAGVLDPNLAETYFACYAFPFDIGVTGNRTLFVNERSQVVSSDDLTYEGTNCEFILGGNALTNGDIEKIGGGLAVGVTGADGNVWKPVN